MLIAQRKELRGAAISTVRGDCLAPASGPERHPALSEKSGLDKCKSAPQAPKLGQISSTKTTTSSRRVRSHAVLQVCRVAIQMSDDRPVGRSNSDSICVYTTALGELKGINRRVAVVCHVLGAPSSGRRPAGKWRSCGHRRARPGGRPPEDRPHTAPSPVRRPERRCRSGGGGNTRALWSHARFKAPGPSKGKQRSQIKPIHPGDGWPPVGQRAALAVGWEPCMQSRMRIEQRVQAEQAAVGILPRGIPPHPSR
eukprot:gene13768-biopygen6535